jgi:hypothetical protein
MTYSQCLNIYITKMKLALAIGVHISAQQHTPLQQLNRAQTGKCRDTGSQKLSDNLNQKCRAPTEVAKPSITGNPRSITGNNLQEVAHPTLQWTTRKEVATQP